MELGIDGSGHAAADTCSARGDARTMRAFVLTGPGECEVQEVPAPVAAPGEVVVDVERVGVCGTDVEFFTGEMAYLHHGPRRLPDAPRPRVVRARSPRSATASTPAWLGRRVTGDTMLGCGNCRRCRRGRQHVCEHRYEVGIRGGRPGALAEQLAVPAASLHALPDAVDAVLGALVEPGGNALRAVAGGRTRARRPAAGARPRHDRPAGRDVRAGRRRRGAPDGPHRASRSTFARSLGLRQRLDRGRRCPDLPFDAVIDASNAAAAARPWPSTWSSRAAGWSTSAWPASPA